MAKTAKRALIESVKEDVAEARGAMRDTDIPFSAESFFDGIDADELFGDSFDVSIERDAARTT